MERVAEDVFGRGCFWCPRCGTIRTTSKDETEQWVNTDDVPKLVERCREIERSAHPVPLFQMWHRLGIAEAINLPGQRFREK
jgi:uncharacterized C2H2 Zn-finger protein